MDLPSSRELELEALLRKKDSQLAELTDEVNTLRQYLSTQPNASFTEPLSLPPALISLLLTHIDAASAETSVRSSSSTVNTALAQRAKLLQEENDELYELLKSSETGKLKEEVRGLRRAVNRLETALRESHQVIRSLSDELEKSYEIVLPPTRPVNASSRHTQQAPLHGQAQTSGNPNGNGHGNGGGGGSGSGSVNKHPPTAPRAHKKPRLSEVRASPATSSNALPRLQTQTRGRSASHHMDSPENSPLQSPDFRKAPGGKVETVTDEEQERMRDRERERERGRSRERERDAERRSRHRSPVAPREPRERERERNRERERDRERDRPRERERDRDRTSRRGGGHSRKGRSGGGGGGYNGSDRDRTLAERMGL
ncbi:hypothetical protein BJV78DRAFT_1212085 [Lactifluus subvellereus]|nr:hypothetical protein BJV78DRAFT_1212085 [Lactifluus subvellereus]